MKRRILARVAAISIALLCGGIAKGEEGEARESLAFLYVAANEGAASGGHAGIRFGDHVFHFQNRAGLLSLDRVPVPVFRHTYALVANRNIEASEIDVDPKAAARLRAAFDRRYLAQARQLAVSRALAEDVALFEA